MLDIVDTKPALFFKPDSSIWTDPYIQENLLQAHLNPDTDAASRNPDSINKTVNFIHSLIKPNSQLLDLGCGPGLYAALFSAAGHKVTGVDFNQKAIDYARSQNTTNKFIQADYLRDFPQGNYDAITMIYCDMGTHSDNARDSLLNNCYHALNQGGKLIFDVFSDKIVQDKTEGKHWDYYPEANFWSPEPALVLQQTFHYPEHHAFGYQYNLLAGNENKYFLLWERYYTETEIVNILEHIGFKAITIKRDLLTGNNFTSSHEMFIVAEK